MPGSAHRVKEDRSMVGSDVEPFPFKPGDWVVDSGERVAKVKGVSRFNGDVYLDLYIYSDRGERIGRTSPVDGWT
jgi:hypothetical protein